MRTFILLFTLALLSGCVVSSTHPLTKPDTGDNTLTGKWALHSDTNETEYLTITKTKKKNILHFRYEEAKSSEKDKIMEFDGHVSVLEGKKYLNLKPTTNKNEFPEGYLFVSYRVEKERLTLMLLNPKPVQHAIDSGNLRGRYDKEKFLSDTLITEKGAKLRRFILDHHDELFGDEGIFERVY